MSSQLSKMTKWYEKMEDKDLSEEMALDRCQVEAGKKPLDMVEEQGEGQEVRNYI